VGAGQVQYVVCRVGGPLRENCASGDLVKLHGLPRIAREVRQVEDRIEIEARSALVACQQPRNSSRSVGHFGQSPNLRAQTGHPHETSRR
jgi:hypothetical protein